MTPSMILFKWIKRPLPSNLLERLRSRRIPGNSSDVISVKSSERNERFDSAPTPARRDQTVFRRPSQRVDGEVRHRCICEPGRPKGESRRLEDFDVPQNPILGGVAERRGVNHH
ncbi:hypothetical protein BHM03_00030187 [Ensete ventricosum]|nr:hypothetical protein BHM03_00030187 [Ensete ventricosum]